LSEEERSKDKGEKGSKRLCERKVKKGVRKRSKRSKNEGKVKGRRKK
jgi:hypothetical protein